LFFAEALGPHRIDDGAGNEEAEDEDDHGGLRVNVECGDYPARTI
jgi:hypothetical protein